MPRPTRYSRFACAPILRAPLAIALLATTGGCAPPVWSPAPGVSRPTSARAAFSTPLRNGPQVITARLANDLQGIARIHLYAVDATGRSWMWSPRGFDAQPGETVTLLAGERVRASYAVVRADFPTVRLSTTIDLFYNPPGAAPAPILSWESTVETEILLRALERGLWKRHHSFARVRQLITPAIAQAISDGPHFDAAADLLLEATLASMDAWHDAAKRESGLGNESMIALYGTLARRQAGLDLELLQADTPEEVLFAEMRFERAQRQLYRDAGLNSAALAHAAEAAAAALTLEDSGDGPAPLRSALRAVADQLRRKYDSSAITMMSP